MLSSLCFLLFLVFGSSARPSGQQIESVNGARVVHNKKGEAWQYYALEQDEDGYQYVKRYAVTWKIK